MTLSVKINIFNYNICKVKKNRLDGLILLTPGSIS